MGLLQKQIVVDEAGQPQAVIIAWEDFQKIERELGLDLDDEAVRDLRKARSDREQGGLEEYVDLDDV